MNKFQKSLDRIKKNVPLHEDGWTDEDKEHIITIMKALEKQIPKPLKERSDKFLGCCNCGDLISNGANYCSLCGQAIRLE